MIQSTDYSVYVKNTLQHLADFIQQGQYSKIFVLTDELTSKHCLPLIQPVLDKLPAYDLIEIASGEENKNIDFCIGIWKMLVDFGADRHALLINLGGGVITDMGGFAASTYKRGIDFIQVPTTLLSQVDASVGGKTGIDMDHIKNIIGTFTSPKAVFVAHEFLETLPKRQILSGLAEMLKHGLIADAEYWNNLVALGPKMPAEDLVNRSVEIKNRIVMDDPHERGFRKALNFGHTIGHAVETYSLENDANHLTHGEAIAMGMICEAWLSHKKSTLSAEALDQIVEVIRKWYPKYYLDDTCHTILHGLMKKDKKNKGAEVNCTLLTRIGDCTIDHICTEEELCDSLKYYASL
ncbi:3-dehydroquinate synthase [Mucilaginibacter koreensis]